MTKYAKTNHREQSADCRCIQTTEVDAMALSFVSSFPRLLLVSRPDLITQFTRYHVFTATLHCNVYHVQMTMTTMTKLMKSMQILFFSQMKKTDIMACLHVMGQQ